MAGQCPQVVIVGAGFGCLRAARAPAHSLVEAMLVDGRVAGHACGS